MNERWRKPVVPIDTEETGKVLFYAGQYWCRTTFILDEEGIERVRHGYVCINCLEPNEHNHPEQCSHCGFPMRAIQDDVFEDLYEGEELVGPRTSDADELEIAQEIVDRGSRS